MTAQERAAWIDEHHTTDVDALTPAWRAQLEAGAAEVSRELNARPQA